MKKQLIKALTLALAISFLQESTLAQVSPATIELEKAISYGVLFFDQILNMYYYNPPFKLQKTKGVRGRRVIQSQGCILSKVDVQLEDQTSEEYWHCELQSSDASETSTRFVVLEGLDDLDLDAEAISGRTTLLIEGAVIADGRLKAPEGAVRKFGKVEKRGPSEANKKRKQEGEGKQARQLAPLQTDMKKVLAVRVKAPDSTTTASLETLRGDIFGIGQGETAVTLSERFKSCSYGQVLMTPYSGQTASGFTVENGVVEIEISTLVSEQDSHTIKNAVTQALSSLLGISDLSAQFDHVMLCLPPGTSGGWIAYGR